MAVVLNAICRVAHGEAERGRGTIFILPIEHVIRIRTGETGADSMG